MYQPRIFRPVNPGNPVAWFVNTGRSNPVLMQMVGNRFWKAGTAPEGAKYPRLIYSYIPVGTVNSGGQILMTTTRITVRAEMRQDILKEFGANSLDNFLCPLGDVGIHQEIQKTFIGVKSSSVLGGGQVWGSEFDSFFQQETQDGGINVLAMGINIIVSAR